jgi:hypothetical protein
MYELGTTTGHHPVHHHRYCTGGHSLHVHHAVDGYMSIEHVIVASTGVGYAIVGTLQWVKGDLPNGMIWVGYAFAQVGLWMNLK